MASKDKTIERLTYLKLQTKFEEDMSIFYPGLEDKNTKDALTRIINKCIDDFIDLVMVNASERDFQQSISKALTCFEVINHPLDTEDRERICRYFEEIMDIVELESSGGILNRWMYGFNMD